MMNIFGWVRKLIDYLKYRKRLKELRKNDPFIYK
jgi:hypothetical protein